MKSLKPRFKNRMVAIILAISLILLPTISSAVDSANILSGYGSDIASIVISGADVQSSSMIPADSDNGNALNKTYTYNIVLSGTTSLTETVVANFTKANSSCTVSAAPRMSPQPMPTIPVVQANQSLAYSATLSGGIGTATAYVFPNLTGDFTRFDTYIFNYSVSPVKNPVSTGNGLRIGFGDPAYPNTDPECYMSFIGSGDAYTATYTGPLNNYYPSTLALYITEGAGGITSMSGTNMLLKVYDANGDVVESGSSLTEHMTNGFYVIELTSTTTAALSITNANGTANISFAAPHEATASAGTAPTSVVSYLPIGQYAMGTGWGSVANKFAGKTSLEGTGVSLGALGGYIEFYFENGIEDNPNNPYGVDFVVYGNAFGGNPEAGAVQISVDGSEWFELAGSHYYDGNFNYTGTTVNNKFANAYTGTLNNADVSYSLSDNKIYTTLKDASGTDKFSNVLFSGVDGWWPLSGEGYPTGTPHMDGNVTVSHSNTALSFGGVTAVPDSNATAFYAFGYADVTPNGSPACYGDAVNPYTPYTSSKTGGDGFDLAWAVDIATRLPVNLSNTPIHYVRVYSAVLDNATFGETSTEVCGIFTVNGSGSGAATSVSGAGLSVTGLAAPSLAATISSANTYEVAADEEITVTFGNVPGANVFVNSASGTGNASLTLTLEDGEEQIVRVIVKDNSTGLPYIGYCKLVGSI